MFSHPRVQAHSRHIERATALVRQGRTEGHLQRPDATGVRPETVRRQSVQRAAAVQKPEHDHRMLHAHRRRHALHGRQRSSLLLRSVGAALFVHRVPVIGTLF